MLAFERLAIEVVVSDMHVVYTLVREAWSDLDIVLFHIEDERQKSFDIRRRDIISVRSLDEGLW